MPEDFAVRESNSTVHPKSGEQKALYEWGLRRFVDEARTLAKFAHPNIVRVLSVFEENNTAYMIMEYAQGKDLSGIFKKSPKMSEDELLDIFIPIMDGLSLVHNAGFIHRDIKPANIYICDNDSPLLLDFGSARQSLGGKTKALTSLVTFGYAPFEQASLYTGITGKKPVDAMARGGCLLEQNIDAYEPASIIAKGEYSDNFLLAVDKALMFKVEDRPAHILECADMLLGKTEAPQLPDFMIRQPESEADETIIRSGVNVGVNAGANASTGGSHRLSKSGPNGPQGLIDSRGVRHSARTDTVIKARNSGGNLNSASAGDRQGSKNNSAPQKSVKPGKSFRQTMVISLLAALVLATVVGLEKIKSESQVQTERQRPGAPEVDNIKTDSDRKKITRNKQQLKVKIEKLLTQADELFRKADYVTPPVNNALGFYQKALKLDENNKVAQQGLKNIEKELLRLAHAAQLDKQYELSHLYLRQIKAVNPSSSNAESLHKKLDSDLNQSRQVTRWLVEAQKHIKNNRYTAPANKNAYDVYRKILKSQPANSQALRGIKTIQNHYAGLFSQHLAASRFNRAKQDIKVMKAIAAPLSDIRMMQRKLASKQQRPVKASRNKPVVLTPTFKKLDIEQVSSKVTQFKTAMQSRNTNEIKKISQFVPGRQQFVEELLSQYKSINVKISGLQLIASKNSAKAQVELKDLVGINGKKIIPGNWSRFAISISYNNKNELKVYW